jgi:tRNA(fMet)-specific endonuclease VapC
MKSTNPTDPTETLAVQQLFLSRFVSLPFDDRAAGVYGRVRARLEVRGTPIGPNDLLIAAIALANDVILVTRNLREFSRIDGLLVEDWEAV